MPFHNLIMHFFSSLNDNPLYACTTVCLSIHLLKEILAHICFHILQLMGFPVAQLIKDPPAMRETWVQSLDWEDPLEKENATHSRILAWRFPWTVQSMGSQRVGQEWATFTFTLQLMNRATVNIYVQVLCRYVFSSFGQIPRSTTAGLYGISIFTHSFLMVAYCDMYYW